MKKLLLATVISAMAAVSSPVLAGDWGGGGNFAIAGGSGGVSGILDARKGFVATESDLDAVTRTDTRPNYAAGKASLELSGMFYGKDRNYVFGELVSGGNTGALADSGKGPGAAAGTETGGLVVVEGGAVSDGYSKVTGAGYIASEERSVALDTGRYETADAEAQHVAMGNVNSVAVGSNYASSGGSVTAVSSASADDSNGGYSD